MAPSRPEQRNEETRVGDRVVDRGGKRTDLEKSIYSVGMETMNVFRIRCDISGWLNREEFLTERALSGVILEGGREWGSLRIESMVFCV